MTHDSIRRADGVREIRELDVFEISATATPMNGATRVLSTKSADAEHDVRATARELMLDLLLAPVEGGTPDTPAAQTKPVAPIKSRPSRSNRWLRYFPSELRSVPLAACETAEGDEPDQRDDQPDPETPDEHHDDPDDDDDAACGYACDSTTII